MVTLRIQNFLTIPFWSLSDLVSENRVRFARSIKKKFSLSLKTVKKLFCFRYEREKEKVTKLKSKCDTFESELTRWRSGETVKLEEQVNMAELNESVTPMSNSEISIASTINLGPVRPTAGAGLMVGSFSNDERQKIEAEREQMYQQLDEKDEEINQYTQLIEKLKEQIMEQEELISCSRKDLELQQIEMTRIQQENDNAKEEVKEVLQALEELAVNYDQKSQEVESKNKEIESVSDELLQKQSSYNFVSSELQQLKDMSSHQRKRLLEMLSNHLKDLSEIGNFYNCFLKAFI